MWDNLRRRLRDQRGVTLVLVAGSMVGLLSIMALAVDFGMLASARTEAQRVADLSALAGAGGLVLSPNSEPVARALAIDYAGRNTIRHESALVEDGDVVVDLANDRVTVTVYRTEERGNAVNTFFARVFGISSVAISARATAEASPAGGLNCLLPLALPDRWYENGGPGNDPLDYEAEHGDYYIPWDPANPSAPYTGYSEADIGTRIRIKANTGSGDMNPDWYYPWSPPQAEAEAETGVRGADLYQKRIAECLEADKDLVYGVGAVVDTEPGSMTGPTIAGFTQLMNSDQTASFNEGLKCVTDLVDKLSSDPSTCRGSTRIRPIPMFDPTVPPDPGRNPFTITNFVGVFVEDIVGNEIWARFVGYTGFANGAPLGEGASSALFKRLRLVE